MSLRLRFFCFFVFFFKQKTAYEMRISDWSSDVCSSDLLVVLFQEYGDRYGFDWLMVGAQGYQESKLDQSARSKAGAIGIMQLLPSTAADPNVGIPDITTERNNIHAGVRYLRFLRDRSFSEQIGRASGRERGGQSG